MNVGDFIYMAKWRNIYGKGFRDLPIKGNEKSFCHWRGMLLRCYCKSYLKTQPTYNDCSVCGEWLLFSNFKKWFDEQLYLPEENMVLDKDIVVKGNKVYSPSTCCLVPSKINLLFTKSNKRRGDLPIGVTRHRKSFAARANIGHFVSLGHFSTPRAAFLAYKEAKEQYVKELAEKYYKEGKITERVYNALLNYRVEITD